MAIVLFRHPTIFLRVVKVVVIVDDCLAVNMAPCRQANVQQHECSRQQKTLHDGRWEAKKEAQKNEDEMIGAFIGETSFFPLV